MRRLPSCLPVLETERLLLRAVAITDVTNLQAIYGDPQVMRYASDPAFMHESAYVDRKSTRLNSSHWE